MNWFIVAAVVAVLYLGAFGFALSRRSWTRGGLAVGIANLPLAFLVSAAPVRGWADPDYAGFVFGLVQVPPGPPVTLVAGSILILATLCACFAVLPVRRARMLLIAGFDALIALNLAGSLVQDLATRPESLRLELGTYVQIGPLGSVLLLSALLVAPLLLCAIWAGRNARSLAQGSPGAGAVRDGRVTFPAM